MKIGIGIGLNRKQGSQSIGELLYQSDFSVSTDGFSVIQTTIAGNIDGVNGVDDTLRSTINSATNIHRFQRNNAWTVGDSITIFFDYYIPSTNALVDNIGFLTGVGADGRQTFNIIDTWTSASATFLSTSGNTLVFEMRDGASISFAGNGTDVVYIKNVIITKI